MANTHSIYGPSCLERRMNCPASKRMELPYWNKDEESSEAATEGSMLHDLCATCKSLDEALAKQPNLSVDQQKCVQKIINIYNSYREVEGNECFNEEHLILEDAELEGTPDFIVINHSKLYGVIRDSKFGRKEVSVPMENPQLCGYVVLAAARWPDIKKWEVFIDQPRCFNENNESYVYTDLDAIANFIKSIISKCEQNDAPFNTGDHCLYCKARCECLEYNKQVMEVARIDARSLPLARTMTTEELVRIKRGKSLLEKWVKDECDPEIIRRINETGEGVDGYKIAKGKETKTVKEINDLFGELYVLGVKEEDFRKACNVSYPTVLEITVAKLREKAAVNGEKLSVANAEKEAKDILKKHFEIKAGESYLLAGKSNKKG